MDAGRSRGRGIKGIEVNGVAIAGAIGGFGPYPINIRFFTGQAAVLVSRITSLHGVDALPGTAGFALYHIPINRQPRIGMPAEPGPVIGGLSRQGR